MISKYFQLQLRTFSIAQFDSSSINGIQVHLTNGYSSPLFKGSKYTCPLRELEDLSEVELCKIGMLAQSDQPKSYFGIQAIEKKAKNKVIDEVWRFVSGEAFKYVEIPDGQRVVGVYGYIWNDSFIHQLGLVTVYDQEEHYLEF